MKIQQCELFVIDLNLFEQEEKDEFDLIVEEGQKPLLERLSLKMGTPIQDRKWMKPRKKKSDDFTLPKSDSKKGGAKGRGKKQATSSDEDGNLDPDSDTHVESLVEPVVPRERVSRRAATTKKVYYVDDSEEDESNSDQELFENDLVKDEPKPEVVALTDSDEEMAAPVRNNKTSDELFDSLIESEQSTNVEDDSDIPIAEKMAAEKRKAASDGSTNSKKLKSDKKR